MPQVSLRVWALSFHRHVCSSSAICYVTVESFLTSEAQLPHLEVEDNKICFNNGAVLLYCHRTWQQLGASFLGTERVSSDSRELRSGSVEISPPCVHSLGLLRPSRFDTEPQSIRSALSSWGHFISVSSAPPQPHLTSWPSCADRIHWGEISSELWYFISGSNS